MHVGKAGGFRGTGEGAKQAGDGPGKGQDRAGDPQPAAGVQRCPHQGHHLCLKGAFFSLLQNSSTGG